MKKLLALLTILALLSGCSSAKEDSTPTPSLKEESLPLSLLKEESTQSLDKVFSSLSLKNYSVEELEDYLLYVPSETQDKYIIKIDNEGGGIFSANSKWLYQVKVKNISTNLGDKSLLSAEANCMYLFKDDNYYDADTALVCSDENIEKVNNDFLDLSEWLDSLALNLNDINFFIEAHHNGELDAWMDGKTSSDKNENNDTLSTDYSPTTGEKNALTHAKSYLNVMPFSYNGLVKQLEYEGYTTDEATYAVEHCGADWNKQAELTAQTYIDTMSFSRQGLIDQLLFEGFTQEQAEHGVTSVGY